MPVTCSIWLLRSEFSVCGGFRYWKSFMPCFIDAGYTIKAVFVYFQCSIPFVASKLSTSPRIEYRRNCQKPLPEFSGFGLTHSRHLIWRLVAFGFRILEVLSQQFHGGKIGPVKQLWLYYCICVFCIHVVNAYLILTDLLPVDNFVSMVHIWNVEYSTTGYILENYILDHICLLYWQTGWSSS